MARRTSGGKSQGPNPPPGVGSPGAGSPLLVTYANALNINIWKNNPPQGKLTGPKKAASE
eukprot:1079671-Prorocentrum_minimum.AAC.4